MSHDQQWIIFYENDLEEAKFTCISQEEKNQLENNALIGPELWNPTAGFTLKLVLSSLFVQDGSIVLLLVSQPPR